MTDDNDDRSTTEVTDSVLTLAQEIAAELLATRQQVLSLQQQVAEHRPWLFEPGDKVLCLIEQAPGGPMIVSGVVQQVRIPGPIHTSQTVQVQMDDDDFVPEEMGLLWWNPDKLERIHG